MKLADIEVGGHYVASSDKNLYQYGRPREVVVIGKYPVAANLDQRVLVAERQTGTMYGQSVDPKDQASVEYVKKFDAAKYLADTKARHEWQVAARKASGRSYRTVPDTDETPKVKVPKGWTIGYRASRIIREDWDTYVETKALIDQQERERQQELKERTAAKQAAQQAMKSRVEAAGIEATVMSERVHFTYEQMDKLLNDIAYFNGFLPDAPRA